MIRRLLVANRGEIARRVFRTCRALGIETVAVYSDPDAEAPHAREADYAVRLPGAAPADTYLRGDLIVAAAVRAGADAVHPGYGFLAENAGFAEAVLDAGLTWVGPPPKAIAAMGSKVDAKRIMAAAGVPVLSGDTYPLLVKASAGGGGRGMRIVRDPAGLDEALAAARREAEAAFGDGTVFTEPYVERARHIEVQIMADAHGTVLALGERECSIQRRHQKIVEEAPSPAVDDALRKRLCDAATTAARAVGYVGAGTVEFLLSPDGDFHFLEMNTRLQVEHPVTECVHDIDLVRWQLLVAEGEPLPPAPPARGHAIEVRLYAEDPANGWLPSTGILHRFAIDGLRVDSGVEDGTEVGPHYDPMLAKVIAWAPTRREAARALATALVTARIHGVVTNRDLLVRVLRDEDFLAGDTDTGFLDRHPAVFAPLVSTVEHHARAAALTAAAGRVGRFPGGWRNLPSAPQVVEYRQAPTGSRSDKLRGSGGIRVEYEGAATAENHVVLDVDGVRRRYDVHRVGDVSYVDGPEGSVTLTELPRFPVPEPEAAQGSLTAPLPGAVGRVAVEPGQRVAAGDLLLTLEAMKLEHPVLAPHAGTVAALPVAAGQQVDTGTVLAIIDTVSAPEE
ncbi:MAG: acety-l/propionyl-CoA carboxylase subunit alpha [Actinobacteria bacterium 13_1_20CM_3_71_11]|nr:MAG: acety-l/propionyl-CoA carboxylase subunit alpha [Actinobacteria bacterium 13_1_20CM_3_71_11]